MSAEGFTVKIERNDPVRGSLSFDFSDANGTVEKFNEDLDKKVHKGSALKSPKALVQDFLRNEHIFTITYVATTAGGVSAWARKRTLQDYLQNVGKTWKLSLILTGLVNESWYVVPLKVQCIDLGGMTANVRIIVQLIETENIEEITP